MWWGGRLTAHGQWGVREVKWRLIRPFNLPLRGTVTPAVSALTPARVPQGRLYGCSPQPGQGGGRAGHSGRVGPPFCQGSSVWDGMLPMMLWAPACPCPLPHICWGSSHGSVASLWPQHHSGGCCGSWGKPRWCQDPQPFGTRAGERERAYPCATAAPMDLPPAESHNPQPKEGAPVGRGTCGGAVSRPKWGQPAEGTMLGTGRNNSTDGSAAARAQHSPAPSPAAPTEAAPRPGRPRPRSGGRNPARPVSGLGRRRQEPAPSRAGEAPGSTVPLLAGLLAGLGAGERSGGGGHPWGFWGRSALAAPSQ